jgi:hypothetical protein
MFQRMLIVLRAALYHVATVEEVEVEDLGGEQDDMMKVV